MQATLGLRDTKRAQNRARMERAAVQIVLEDGLSHVTIEAICERSEMSVRSFFNHFDGKEDAILGLPDLRLTEETILWHVRNAVSGDVVDAVLGIIFDLTGSIFDNTSLQDSRAEILRRHPELFNRQAARLAVITDELLRAVATLMEYDERFSTSAGSVPPLAEPILSLCAGAARAATKEWLTDGGQSPVGSVKVRSVEIAHDVVERLR